MDRVARGQMLRDGRQMTEYLFTPIRRLNSGIGRIKSGHCFTKVFMFLTNSWERNQLVKKTLKNSFSRKSSPGKYNFKITGLFHKVLKKKWTFFKETNPDNANFRTFPRKLKKMCRFPRKSSPRKSILNSRTIPGKLIERWCCSRKSSPGKDNFKITTALFPESFLKNPTFFKETSSEKGNLKFQGFSRFPGLLGSLYKAALKQIGEIKWWWWYNN